MGAGRRQRACPLARPRGHALQGRPRLRYSGAMTRSTEPSLIRLARGAQPAADPLPLDLGVRVRELRTKRGWTLEQAARRAGLARSTLSKIENGQMSPTYEALKKLAEGLEISVPQLFTPPSKGQVMGRILKRERSWERWS